MAILYYLHDRNDSYIWQLIPGWASKLKHLDVIVNLLQWFEPMDIGQWFARMSKMIWEVEDDMYFSYTKSLRVTFVSTFKLERSEHEHLPWRPPCWCDPSSTWMSTVSKCVGTGTLHMPCDHSGWAQILACSGFNICSIGHKGMTMLLKQLNWSLTVGSNGWWLWCNVVRNLWSASTKLTAPWCSCKYCTIFLWKCRQPVRWYPVLLSIPTGTSSMESLLSSSSAGWSTGMLVCHVKYDLN